jgi:ketosteroid isomerase-like protein
VRSWAGARTSSDVVVAVELLIQLRFEGAEDRRYWLLLEVRAAATLRHVDTLLRRTWLRPVPFVPPSAFPPHHRPSSHRAMLRVLLLTAALTACAGYRPRTPTEAAADAAAHRAHEQYVAAINSNDLERLLAMLTDDVVFLAANEPPMVGKSAVRPWLQASYAAYHTHWDMPVQEFFVQGEWACERYAWTSTDTSRADGLVVRGTGWGLLLYHRDADGQWRVARDAFGPDHPPAPAP